MATKKFIIEVEEGETRCNEFCPVVGCEGCIGGFEPLCCDEYNLATMRIKELKENKIMKARYTQDENGFYIKEVKKHWFSRWKIVTTIHLGTTIPQLYIKEDNNYIPI